MTTVRLDEQKRREIIVTAARRIAAECGFWAVTHGTVAKRCTVHTSTALVRHYYQTKDDLWRGAIGDDPVMMALARDAGWVS